MIVIHTTPGDKSMSNTIKTTTEFELELQKENFTENREIQQR